MRKLFLFTVVWAFTFAVHGAAPPTATVNPAFLSVTVNTNQWLTNASTNLFRYNLGRQGVPPPTNLLVLGDITVSNATALINLKATNGIRFFLSDNGISFGIVSASPSGRGIYMTTNGHVLIAGGPGDTNVAFGIIDLNTLDYRLQADTNGNLNINSQTASGGLAITNRAPDINLVTTNGTAFRIRVNSAQQFEMFYIGSSHGVELHTNGLTVVRMSNAGTESTNIAFGVFRSTADGGDPIWSVDTNGISRFGQLTGGMTPPPPPLAVSTNGEIRAASAGTNWAMLNFGDPAITNRYSFSDTSPSNSLLTITASNRSQAAWQLVQGPTNLLGFTSSNRSGLRYTGAPFYIEPTNGVPALSLGTDKAAMFYGSLSVTGLLTAASNIVANWDLVLLKTNTPIGTTGNMATSARSGTVRFAASATQLFMTNAFVTGNSVVQLTVATNDATAAGLNFVQTAGLLQINLKTAPTGETPVAFLITQ